MYNFVFHCLQFSRNAHRFRKAATEISQKKRPATQRKMGKGYGWFPKQEVITQGGHELAVSPKWANRSHQALACAEMGSWTTARSGVITARDLPTGNYLNVQGAGYINPGVYTQQNTSSKKKGKLDYVERTVRRAHNLLCFCAKILRKRKRKNSYSYLLICVTQLQDKRELKQAYL